MEAPDRSVFSIMHDDTENGGSIEWIEPLAYYLKGPLYPCLTEELIAKFCCPTVIDADVAAVIEAIGPTMLHELLGSSWVFGFATNDAVVPTHRTQANPKQWMTGERDDASLNGFSFWNRGIALAL